MEALHTNGYRIMRTVLSKKYWCTKKFLLLKKKKQLYCEQMDFQLYTLQYCIVIK